MSKRCPEASSGVYRCPKVPRDVYPETQEFRVEMSKRSLEVSTRVRCSEMFSGF